MVNINGLWVLRDSESSAFPVHLTYVKKHGFSFVGCVARLKWVKDHPQGTPQSTGWFLPRIPMRAFMLKSARIWETDGKWYALLMGSAAHPFCFSIPIGGTADGHSRCNEIGTYR